HEPGMEAQLLSRLQEKRALLWVNSRLADTVQQQPGLDPALAEHRFDRYAAALAHIFPEIKATGGHLCSVLQPIPKVQQALRVGARARTRAHAEPRASENDGTWLLKRDDALPVAGSV